MTAPGPRDVLFLHSYTGLGGGETSLLALLGAIDRDRARPALLVPREGPLPEAARALDVRVHVIPFRGVPTWFVPALWERLPAARAMTDLLRRETPHVVRTDFHALPYAAAACRRAGVPLVFECWAWWFRPRPWQRRFYRRHVRRIIARSVAIRDGFLGAPPVLHPERVSVVSPGVDLDRFRPRHGERAALREALGLPADAAVVTLLARFQRVKGHDVFLEAARAIAARAPGTTFVIAGDDAFDSAADAAFGRRVQALAAEDPLLAPRVRFIGRTSTPERLLAVSDVLVCSSHFETFGMALVEAMSCEVPVVSTDRGGPAETVVHGETGLLVSPARPDLIAASVLDLLADADLRRRLGRAGRRRVAERFSTETQAARYMELVLAAATARS